MDRSDVPGRLGAAEVDVGSRESVPDVLNALARHLVDVLDGSASVVSRIVGEMIVQLAEHTRSDVNLKQLGHGYLIADYPLTQEVLERSEPRTVSLADADADPAEARLLRELGFQALLMTPLCVRDEPWALAEVYGSTGSSFDEASVRDAAALADAAGAALERLGAA